jgi:hypothetical protein
MAEIRTLAKVSLQNTLARDGKSKTQAANKDAGKGWAGRLPLIKPGRYADGLPFHDINYLSFKLVLKPNRLDSRKSLFQFGKQVVGPCAEANDVDFSIAGFQRIPIRIREVLFIDTPDYRLYKNAFILRRRICYEDGFPVGDPEIVFKFRHTDIQRAAETDVRPQIAGSHTISLADCACCIPTMCSFRAPMWNTGRSSDRY